LEQDEMGWLAGQPQILSLDFSAPIAVWSFSFTNLGVKIDGFRKVKV